MHEVLPGTLQAVPSRLTLLRIDLKRGETQGPELTAPTFLFIVSIPEEEIWSIRLILQAQDEEDAGFYGDIEFQIDFTPIVEDLDRNQFIAQFTRNDIAYVIWSYAFPFLDTILSQMGLPPLRHNVTFPHPEILEQKVKDVLNDI